MFGKETCHSFANAPKEYLSWGEKHSKLVNNKQFKIKFSGIPSPESWRVCEIARPFEDDSTRRFWDSGPSIPRSFWIMVPPTPPYPTHTHTPPGHCSPYMVITIDSWMVQKSSFSKSPTGLGGASCCSELNNDLRSALTDSQGHCNSPAYLQIAATEKVCNVREGEK